MAATPGAFRRRPDVVARQKLIWRTWITHRALGYVPIVGLNAHVAGLLGVSVARVLDVVQMTKADGCFS